MSRAVCSLLRHLLYILKSHSFLCIFPGTHFEHKKDLHLFVVLDVSIITMYYLEWLRMWQTEGASEKAVSQNR